MASVDRIAKDGAKKHYEEAKRMLQAGPRQDLEGAIAQLTKAIFLVEDVPAYFEERGRAFLLLRDYKSAVSNFSQCLKMQRGATSPELQELRRRTSNLLVAEGLSRLQVCSPAPRSAPRQPLPVCVCVCARVRAWAHTRAGRRRALPVAAPRPLTWAGRRAQAREFSDAIHLFTVALDTDPTNIYVHVHRALAKIGQQKFEDALQGLITFLEDEGSSPKAKLPIHILTARLNKQLKNPTLAAHHVQEALNIDPNNAEALKLYAQLKGRAGELYNEATDLLLKNEPRKAIECLTHAVDLDDQDPRFLVRRGVIHRQLGQYNEAVADLEQVCALVCVCVCSVCDVCVCACVSVCDTHTHTHTHTRTHTHTCTPRPSHRS